MTTVRDALLARSKRRYIESEIEFEGMYLWWRSLSEHEKALFEAQHTKKDGAKNMRAILDLRPRVIVLCAVDGDGKRLFSDADVPQLRKVDGKVISDLADEAMAHAGWTDGDIEELAKNSAETDADDSPTS